MNYYKLRAIVGQRLRDWINNPDDKKSWLSFTRGIAFEFGVPPKMALKMLSDFYPNLTIENDKLVRVEEDGF